MRRAFSPKCVQAARQMQGDSSAGWNRALRLLSAALLAVLMALAPAPSSASDPADDESGFIWELQLTEAGLVVPIMRCTLSQEDVQKLELRFHNQIDASRYDGLEIVARADRLAPFRMEASCFDEDIPLTVSEDQEKETVGPTTLLGTEKRVHRIPFDQFRIPTDLAREVPGISRMLDSGTLRSVRFTTTASGATLEIHSVSLYVGQGESSTVLHIDGFGGFLSEGLDASWNTISCNEDGCSWNHLEPSFFATTSSYAWVHHQGGTLEVVEDPTGQGRGLVTRVTVPPLGLDGNLQATSGPIHEGLPHILVSRVYGFVIFPYEAPPITTQVDIWASKELVETAIGSTIGTVLLDVYDVVRSGTPVAGSWRSPYGEKVNSSLQAKLWTPSMQDGKAYLNLKYGPQAHTVADVLPGPPAFTAETWHTLRITVLPDRTAQLYQDGQLVSETHLWEMVLGGTVGGHLGLYIHDSVQRGEYAVRGEVLYDNYRIVCGRYEH